MLDRSAGVVSNSRLVIAILFLIFVPGHASSNENTTMVLHAVQTGFLGCDIEDPCVPSPGSPTIDIVEPDLPQALYFIVRNYEVLGGVQAAFEVDPSWNFSFCWWGCLPNQLDGCASPPWGPIGGTLATAFDCVTGGASAIVSVFHFASTPRGCFDVIRSGFPNGTHVTDCTGTPVQLPEEAMGRVCVGPGGINTCEPGATPVLATTWGAIRLGYRSQ